MIETENSADNTLTLEHSGPHHQARITLDPETKRANAGVIANFANNSSVGLQIVDGRARGTLVHSGDTHTLFLEAEKDGSFRGSYKDKNGLEIDIDGDEATLKHGEIPTTGIAWNRDHHRVRIERAPDGKISGSIESLNTDKNQFAIKIEDGKLNGSFTHAGNSHTTEVSLNDQGWKANITAGKGDAKFNFGISNGKTGKQVFAGVKWKF